MANDGLITSTVAKSAYDELQKLDNSLESVYQNILKINGIKGSTPSILAGASVEAQNAVKQLANVRDAVNEVIKSNQVLTKSEKEAANSILKANQVERSNIATKKARNAEIEKAEKLEAKEQAKLAASQSVYNKVQQKLNALNLEYKELAVQKEITGRLTDNEAKRYDFLQKRIQKYDTVLKTVDASMGKYQRNVGNYASGFNPLNNAINQLGREAPSFANSLQTGFLAISNNLPALFDALGGIVDQNKQLQAQGKPTVSVFKQMAAAVFSLQTALSVGVTLLTIYGADIIAAFSGSSKVIDEHRDKVNQLQSTYTEQAVILTAVEKALNETNSSQSELNNALKLAEQQGISLNAIEEARKGNLYLINKEIQENIDLSIKQAKAQALVQLIVENEIETAKRRRELGQSYESTWRNAVRVLEYFQTGTSGFDNQQLKSINDLTDANKEYYKMLQELGLDSLLQDEKVSKDKQKQVEKEKDFLASLYEYRKMLNDAEIRGYQEIYDEQLKYFSEREKASEAISAVEVKNAELRRLESLRVLERQNQEETAELRRKLANNEITQANYNAVILSMEKDLRNKQDIVSEEFYKDLYDSTKNGEERILKLRQDYQKDFNDWFEKYEGEGLRVLNREQLLDDWNDRQKKRLKEQEELLKRLRKATDEYLEGFVSSAFNDFGFNATYNLLKVQENGKTTFENLIAGAETAGERAAVIFTSFAEVSQEAFAFINQNQQATFDGYRRELDLQQQVAEGFAITEEAKAEVARQYEERRRLLRRRELEAQKEQAIFNAVINTAQAVTAALAEGGIILAALVGALGAAQIALISSQDIPAYAEGTDYHKGGLALVGDGGRREIIKTPDGGLFRTPAKDTLVDMPKGSQVYKSEADFLRDSGVLNSRIGSDIPNMQQLTVEDIANGVAIGMANMAIATTILDKNGITTNLIQGNVRHINHNNRVAMKGITVKP